MSGCTKASPSFSRCTKIHIFISFPSGSQAANARRVKLLEQSKVFGSIKLFKSVTAGYVFM